MGVLPRAAPLADSGLALDGLCETAAKQIPTNSTVQWAFHPQPRLVHDVRVDLRGADVVVTQKLLDGSDSR